jgi:hypothetical protein
MWVVRPEVRAECHRYQKIAALENALVRVRSESLDPCLLKARIMEMIENAPSGTGAKLRALVLGYVVLGLRK